MSSAASRSLPDRGEASGPLRRTGPEGRSAEAKGSLHEGPRIPIPPRVEVPAHLQLPGEREIAPHSAVRLRAMRRSIKKLPGRLIASRPPVRRSPSALSLRLRAASGDVTGTSNGLEG